MTLDATLLKEKRWPVCRVQAHAEGHVRARGLLSVSANSSKTRVIY